MAQGAQTKPLNAHEAPPQQLKDIFKKYQRLKLNEIHHDQELFNTGNNKQAAGSIPSDRLHRVFSEFLDVPDALEIQELGPAHIYSPKELPGLLILPSLIPEVVQRELLSRLLHRDLSLSKHKTNLHMHYSIPYSELEHTEDQHGQESSQPSSFFSISPDSPVLFPPKDPAVHKPLSITQVMEKKLRWVTLGGQYDWTNKVYPDEAPPAFPEDIAKMINGLFPEMEAQAAIVNLYSPGDTLSLHRDVSEEVDRGLVSISLGCDCLFIIGLNSDVSDGSGGQTPMDRPKFLTVRLKSGDAVYMSEESRFAWHGVPKVILGTCPDYLSDWPAENGNFEPWRGWMMNKRINLNVRQMR